MKTILQVPLDKRLKNSAEKVATEQGFSSLQEIVRVFLTQLATKRVEVTLQESMSLSAENEKRYVRMTQDFKSGTDVLEAVSVEELITKLDEDQIP